MCNNNKKREAGGACRHRGHNKQQRYILHKKPSAAPHHLSRPGALPGSFLARCLRPHSASCNGFGALGVRQHGAHTHTHTPLEQWYTCKSLNDIDGGWNLVNLRRRPGVQRGVGVWLLSGFIRYERSPQSDGVLLRAANT